MKEKTAREVASGALAIWLALMLALMALPAHARADEGGHGVLRAQTAIIAAAATTPYQVYLPVLGRAVMGLDEFAGDYQAAAPDAWAPTFAVFDLSADGVPEMMVRTQTFAGRNNVHVFTVGANAATYLGSYAEGNGGSFGNVNAGAVYTLDDASSSYVNSIAISNKAIASKYGAVGTHAQAASYLSARGASAITFAAVADLPDLAGAAKYNLRGATVSVSGTCTYNGAAQTPKVTVRFSNKNLVANTDYRLTYSNNVNAGTATVTVTGMGDYAGTKTATFTINQCEITRATSTAIAAKTYNRAAQTPTPALTYNKIALRNGADYTAAYTNNVNAGTARITVTGKGNYKGTRTLTFTINRANISSASVAKIKAQKYTGKAKKPKPTVKFGGATLKNNTDYTLSYTNNTKKSKKAQVTIYGKGNFQGSKTVKFTIK